MPGGLGQSEGRGRFARPRTFGAGARLSKKPQRISGVSTKLEGTFAANNTAILFTNEVWPPKPVSFGRITTVAVSRASVI